MHLLVIEDERALIGTLVPGSRAPPHRGVPPPAGGRRLTLND